VAKRTKKPKLPETAKRKGQVPYAVRVRIVQAVMRGATHADAAVAFGVSTAVVQKFVGLFHAGGIEALHPKVAEIIDAAKPKPKSKPKRHGTAAAVPRDEVVAARAANPDWGTRRIRDVLARFEGLGVSETTVRRILHEAGLLVPQVVEEPRAKPERRFERAEPNQMWQSDIFTFELRRHQRVYLVGFMDDYSRYLVSWAMAHHQKSSLVIEALERGIAEYGQPHEVLTDQGRQYAAWRGETEFQEQLRRHGIKHSKSRPQHPETLGKIERFWKTLWEEFLRKTVFADFADCLRRLELFVQHYNFQRPHQGIDSSVPADRYFRAAPHVRAAVEAQVKANALRLAQEKPAQKPFYLVGRLGDQDLSIAAAGGALRVQVGDASQTIPMTKEVDDETKASRAFSDEEEVTRPREGGPDRGALDALDAALATQHRPSAALPAAVTEEDDDEAQTYAAGGTAAGETGPSTRTAPPWRAAVADRPHGPRPGGAASNDADLVGAVGAHAGNNRDQRAWNLASALLPAGDERLGGDDAGAGAGRGLVDGGRRDAGAADRGPGDEGDAPGDGEPAARTPAAAREADLAGGTGGVSGAARSETGPALDERWARTFAWLEAAGDDELDEPFDPDAGWRDRAVSWTRKLAGAEAAADGEPDGETASTPGAFDLSTAAGGAAGAATTHGATTSRHQRTDDDHGSSRGARDRAGEHASPRASGGGSDALRVATEADGSDAEALDGESARSAREATVEGEREAPDAAAGGGRDDDGSRRDHPGAAGPRARVLAELVRALETAAEVAEERRRSGTSSPERDPWSRDEAAGDEE
jgi:transposase InsO family protein